MNDRLIGLVRWLRLDGLRARLTVAVAFVVIATLAVSFVFVYNDAGSRLRAELDHDIRGSASPAGPCRRCHRIPRRGS